MRIAVDSRLIQANERTLLAWLRTGVSLITFGFVIARLGVWLHLQGVSERRIPGAPWVGGIFVPLGTVTDVVGIVRYVFFRRATLSEQPTPTSDGAVMLVPVGVTVLGAVLGTLILASMF